MPETPSTIQMLIPVVTGAVGLASGVVIEWLRDARAYQRDAEGRRAAAVAAWSEKRNAFQTQTLLDLQDEVTKWMIAAREMHFSKRNNPKATEEWYEIINPPKLASQFCDSTSQVSKLASRARDSQIRQLVRRLKDDIGGIVNAMNQTDSSKSLTASDATFESLNDRIGSLLRDLDLFENQA